MFRLKGLLIFLLMCFFFQASADEKEKLYYYFGLKVGESQATPLYGNTGLKTGKSSFTYDVVFGKKIHEFISLELDFNHRGKNYTENSISGESNSTSSWEVEAYSFMLNATINLMRNSRVIPFVKAGFGLSNNKSYDYYLYDADIEQNVRFPGRSKVSKAWNLGIGIDFNISPLFSSVIEYRYINRGRVETQDYFVDKSGDKVYQTERYAKIADRLFTIGILYKF